MTTFNSFQAHLNGGESPDETVLPIRTRFLANQLREILKSLSTDQTSTQSTSLDPTAENTVFEEPRGPQQWRYEPRSGAATDRQMPTSSRKRICSEDTDMVVAHRGGDANVRPKSFAALIPIDPDEKEEHLSARTSTSSLAEEIDDIEKGQRYVSFIYC